MPEHGLPARQGWRELLRPRASQIVVAVLIGALAFAITVQVSDDDSEDYSGVRGDHDVGDERDHEHAVVEPPLPQRTQRADDGVERRDDRDRQIGLQRRGHGRLQDETGDDAHGQPDHRDHASPLFAVACRMASLSFGTALTDRSSDRATSNCTPACFLR
jgi:hypothetical protein